MTFRFSLQPSLQEPTPTLILPGTGPIQPPGYAELPANYWRPRPAFRGKTAAIRAHLEHVAKTQGPLAAYEATREVCRRDLYYLAYEVLEYRAMSEDLHNDLCNFLAEAEAAEDSTLILIPRSHFKSTIATIARCIWWIIRDPNVTIGLASGTLENAKKFLREIRNHMEKRATLKALFPEIFFQDPTRESSKWTQTEILVKRTSIAKEPTIKVFGLENAIPTGDHYARIVCDDIVDQEIVTSETRILGIADQIQYLRPLRITIDQPLHFVGTRYHVRDPYALMLEDADTRVYLRRAVERGKPIFPERFSLEGLEKEREKIGSFKYACQYLMEPGDPTDKKFKTSDVRTHQGVGREIPGYYWVAIVDPANAQRKESDFTAMAVYAVDWDMKFNLVDGVHDKMNPRQRIEAVLALYKRWRFDILGYEAIGFQSTDAFWLRQLMRERNIGFPIKEISHHKQSKFDRIMSIQPIVESGRFLLPDTPIHYARQWEAPDDGKGQIVDIREMMLEQMEHFPMGVHDDMLDTLEMAHHIALQPGFPRPKRPEPVKGAYAMGELARKKARRFNVMAR